jgi:hypothetical protein
MARTYVPTLLSQLRRIERYIERYDTVLQDNIDPTSLNHVNTILTSIRQILALES